MSYIKYSFFTLFVFCIFNLNCQTESNDLDKDNTSKNRYFGIRTTATYNYKIAHLSPSLGFAFSKHNFYVGPEYSTLLVNPLFGDPIDNFEISPLGLNFGYRYLFATQIESLSGFVQLNFSAFKNTVTQYRRIPPNSTYSEIILENTLSLGLSKNISKNLDIQGSVGFGSYRGFFLIIDKLLPTASIGLEFKL